MVRRAVRNFNGKTDILSGWIKAKWGESDNNRRAKFYSLTPAGRKYLEREQANWQRLSTAIGLVLEAS